jgi:hypothetical protein
MFVNHASVRQLQFVLVLDCTFVYLADGVWDFWNSSCVALVCHVLFVLIFRIMKAGFIAPNLDVLLI